MEKIVEVKCIKHKYPDETEVSACGLDFIINKKEKVALVGSNGSGKTTLILHILGLLKPLEGTVQVFGENPNKNFSKIGEKIGAVFQNAEDQLIGPTVLDDIKFSLINYNYPKEEIEKRITEIIKKLDISNIENKVIHYLSGGEKKKVAIAGALALHPQLLVLDESFNQIDPDGLKKVIDLIEEHSKNGMATVMAVSNREDLKYFDKVYFLNKGKITFSGTVEEFNDYENANFCQH